jgi:FkbM family methyltransferase
MKLKEIIKKSIQKTGLTIVRYPTHDQKRRVLAYQHFQIGTLLDVGANSGQYAGLMRELGYEGTIHSFEPTSNAFDLLRNKSKKDKNWHIHKLAIGANTGEVEINISENSFSSSILEIEQSHVISAPQSRYINKETVSIETIDNLFPVITKGARSIFLKIDTQGFESEVLKGAENNLHKIKCIQLEMSLVKLYKNEWLFEETLNYLKKRYFDIYTIEPEFYNTKTGQLLQVDAIFYNRNI